MFWLILVLKGLVLHCIVNHPLEWNFEADSRNYEILDKCMLVNRSYPVLEKDDGAFCQGLDQSAMIMAFDQVKTFDIEAQYQYDTTLRLVR